MKAPNGRLMATVLPRPADTVAHSGAVTPKSFLCPPNFVVLRNLYSP